MKLKIILAAFAILMATTGALGTVTSQTSSVSYACTGSTGPYAFTFPISDATAMTVIQAGTTLGSTAYTITPVNNDYANGGSVTLNTACPVAAVLVLQRNTPLTQDTVFTDNMPLPYASFEDGLDKLTELDQDIWYKSQACPYGQFFSQFSVGGTSICSLATVPGPSSTGIGNGTTIIDVSTMSGADGGAKLAACYTSLPSTGGICDASALAGSQTISSPIFSGMTKSVSVLLGGNWTENTNDSIPTNVTFFLRNNATFAAGGGYTVTGFTAPVQAGGYNFSSNTIPSITSVNTNTDATGAARRGSIFECVNAVAGGHCYSGFFITEDLSNDSIYTHNVGPEFDIIDPNNANPSGSDIYGPVIGLLLGTGPYDGTAMRIEGTGGPITNGWWAQDGMVQKAFWAGAACHTGTCNSQYIALNGMASNVDGPVATIVADPLGNIFLQPGGTPPSDGSWVYLPETQQEGNAVLSPSGPTSASSYIQYFQYTDGASQTHNAGVYVDSSGNLHNPPSVVHPTVYYCGTTTTCANTLENSVRIVVGKVSLGTGTAVIGSISPAFTNTADMWCDVVDETTPSNAVSCALTSTSSVTLTGSGSDTIRYKITGW